MSGISDGTGPGDKPGRSARGTAGSETPGDSIASDPAIDVDPGEPIAELAGLGIQPRATFVDRIRRRIGRRVLAADVIDFSTASPFGVFVEFLALLFEGLGGRNRRNGGTP